MWIQLYLLSIDNNLQIRNVNSVKYALIHIDIYMMVYKQSKCFGYSGQVFSLSNSNVTCLIEANTYNFEQ